MSRRPPLSPISRRTFVQGLAGLIGLAVAGCNPSIQTSSASFSLLSNVVTYYDRSSASHLDQVAALGTQGYRPISLSVYGSPTAPLYAAVWIKRNGPEWQPFNDLDAAQYQNVYNLLTAQGYRPTILSATGSGNSVVFAGVFERDATPFIAKRDLVSNGDADLTDLYYTETDTSTLQYWNQWANANNYILRWATIYGDSAHPRYAGIWEANPARVAWNWDNGYFDDVTTYQNRLRATVAQWARPAFVAISSENQAWSVFRDDQVGPWIAEHALTSSVFQSRLDQHTSRGYYPLVIQGNSAGRFSAIFVKQEKPAPRRWTITGQAEQSLSAFDDLMYTYLRDNGIRAGSMAIAREGRLVYARAYTWAEEGYSITQPSSLFRIASCNKPLTSIVIHQLIEKGHLNLHTNMQQTLQLKTPSGGLPTDPRFDTIEVWHLLSHLGGWNIFMSFDPLLYDAHIARALKVPLPVNKYQIASFMASQPLQFDPGTQIFYSPFGYSLLGQIIEKVTGMSYTQFVKQSILDPLGLKRPRPGRSLYRYRAPGEVRYHGQSPYVEPSVLTPSQPLVPFAYGGINIENRDATGSKLMAPADFVKILAAFDAGNANLLLRPATISAMWSFPPGVQTYGMTRGWYKDSWKRGVSIYSHPGGFPGSCSLIFRRSDNVSFALFFNKDALAQPTGLMNQLNTLADAAHWPGVDLFPSLGIPAFSQ